jgi:hypothetical protein
MQAKKRKGRKIGKNYNGSLNDNLERSDRDGERKA